MLANLCRTEGAGRIGKLQRCKLNSKHQEGGTEQFQRLGCRFFGQGQMALQLCSLARKIMAFH